MITLSRSINIAVVLIGVGLFGLFLLTVGQVLGVIPKPVQNIELTIQTEKR